MSKCYTCTYFKQIEPLDFLINGICVWEPVESIPPWLQNWIEFNDRFYGPKKELGNHAYAVKDCNAHVPAADWIITKRKSETWWEA